MTNTIQTTVQICYNRMGLDSILRKNRTRNLGSFLKKQKSEVEQQVVVEVVIIMIVLVMVSIILVIVMTVLVMMMIVVRLITVEHNDDELIFLCPQGRQY